MSNPHSAHAASLPSSSATLTGIAYGAGAGALWGLVFLAPELVQQFGPLEFTVGRYLCFGILALALMMPRWHRVSAQLFVQHWRRLAWLAFTGNTFYYILLVSAVRTGGIATTTLVLGFLPVAVTIIGSRDDGAVPLEKLRFSLLLCALGMICIGAGAFEDAGGRTVSQRLIGLLCALTALASWTIFAVGNARDLAKLQSLTAHDWNLLTGLMTGAQSLVLLPVVLLVTPLGDHSGVEWARFAAVSAGLAIVASVVGYALWNRASQLLPLTLIGQMILFETLFALLYGLLWEQRLPTLLEVTALVFVTMGVLTCLAAHRRPAPQAQTDDG
ncbi:DMT family transporter [Sinimarinibacterium sp. NLF-5-8]|uniref:DMT family transporter n=1 Tax=Sinimarinibacterium sp. NLF-5-8 TaxID=2698684 RepID=UPI00137BFFE0|nr:DMT family transporter [Sinimarinibacterium sp. NLF-5-8]QHS11262.1 DMT family transporter [Sinimarinibacterium sp. NLF-5-8]